MTGNPEAATPVTADEELREEWRERLAPDALKLFEKLTDLRLQRRRLLDRVHRLEAEASPPASPGDARLREALAEANRIIAMTRQHLADDHPDCAWTGLGVMGDNRRAVLADLPVDAGERRCVECGEPWPCKATVYGTKDGVPHRLAATPEPEGVERLYPDLVIIAAYAIGLTAEQAGQLAAEVAHLTDSSEPTDG